MLEGFRNKLHNQPGIHEIRGRGMMIGIELETPCTQILNNALSEGILLNVTAGNVVRLLPPYILTDAEADELVRRISDLIIDFLQPANTPEAASA